MKRTAALLLAAAATAAHAGRPLTTEDAAVVEDKACQVESWIDRGRDATSGWIVPACNFGAGIEWQAGFARAHAEGRQSFSESYVQAKTLARSPGPGGWGYGFVLGASKFPRRGTHRGYEDPYATGIFTVMPGAATAIHANVGWIRDRAERRDATTWGLAAEHAVTSAIALVGEAFGANSAAPFARVGARFSVVKGFDWDLTVVARKGGASTERFVSLGFTWQSVPFLP